MFWISVYKTINIALVFATPPITALVIFSMYEFQTGKLPSTIAFTTLSMFNILRFPLVVLPKALRAASGEWAAGCSALLGCCAWQGMRIVLWCSHCPPVLVCAGMLLVQGALHELAA